MYILFNVIIIIFYYYLNYYYIVCIHICKLYSQAKYCKNMSKCRELWKTIMKDNHGSESEMWLEYFRLER